MAWMKGLTAAMRSSEVFPLNLAKPASLAAIPSQWAAEADMSYHNAAWLWLSHRGEGA
jgi:hypothetical protein